ncbi:MAG: hypothetical protein HQL68_04575 [Magnetococcales bacterium]|nr:hypothetical protein [Magnetococcales bacterium]
MAISKQKSSQLANKLYELGCWRKMVIFLVEREARKRPGTHCYNGGRPVVWSSLETAEELIKKHGRATESHKGRYGVWYLWRLLGGAKNMTCGWKVALCSKHGSLIYGDSVDVLGVDTNGKNRIAAQKNNFANHTQAA